MFNFTTTTVVNSDKDTSGKDLFKAITKTDPDGTIHKEVMVCRHLTFKDKNIQAIYKREYQAEKAPKVTIDLSGVAAEAATKDQIFRLNLYIRLSGSQDERYANALVYKGKPFLVEFPVKAGEAATAIATKIVGIVNKYQNMVYEDRLVKVTASAGTVVLEGISGEQRFSKVAIEMWDKDEYVTKSELVNGVDATGKITLNEVGANGFGTYRQILKDLRLPTADNTRWGRIVEDEAPIPGAKYDQYTIYYCVNRGPLGSDVVGQNVTSVTCHVFFINKNLTTAWETVWAGTATPGSGILEWDKAKMDAIVDDNTVDNKAFLKVSDKAGKVKDIAEPTEFVKK